MFPILVKLVSLVNQHCEETNWEKLNPALISSPLYFSHSDISQHLLSKRYLSDEKLQYKAIIWEN